MPVFLYGELTAEAHGHGPSCAAAAWPGWRERAWQAGRAAAPDFGPARHHRTAGATLVAARPPLVAFNVELAAAATVKDAQRIAALIREGGEEGLTA